MARLDGCAGILVVEDDPMIAMDIAAMLSDLGFQDLHLAYDLATAMALLLAKSPRLGILDVNIGGHLVFPLAEELRARRIPIIFSTGQAPSELPAEWAVYPILSKPLEARMLAAALGELDLR
ncbi:MAG TPA: response regulator [Dongiaceae bacterium]|nr:response regulator [Dongiaceae bacterium]